MNNSLRLYRIATRAIYKTLGSSLSTKLAKTPLGHLAFKLLNRGKGLNEYEGLEGLKLKLSRDEAYRLGFFHLGTINPFETNVIKKILQEGDCFIDVGAYIDGWHSLIASKRVGNTGKVYCFEPLYYRLLQDNIKLNKLKNIVVSQSALSDKNGSTVFYDRGERSSLNQQKDDSSKIKTVKVKTTTLDSFVKTNKIKKVRLLKVDVEGSEIPVLKGALKLLKSINSPDIIIEAVESHQKSVGFKKSQLMSFLKKLGYKPYSFHKEGLKPYNNKRNGFNLFFSKTLK